VETHAASDLLAELQSQLEPTRIADIESKARTILSGLGFPKANLKKPVLTLSGGWRMRTNLASVLLQPTDILILDEPTNFLDLLGIIVCSFSEHLIPLFRQMQKFLLMSQEF
jgi:ATPase subunit of ABC transporter with duplicated ATPase domains